MALHASVMNERLQISRNYLKTLRELGQKKHREDRGEFIVEGVRLIQEAVDSDFEIIEALHTQDLARNPGGSQLLRKLEERIGDRVRHITSRDMELLSDTVTTQGVLAVVRQKEFTVESILKSRDARSVIVAFDGISDPGNVGTMIRTCDWFGVDGVLLGGNSVELFNPKVVRATMGGVFHLPIVQNVDLLSTISRAKTMGYRIYVTDVHGEGHFDRVQYDHKSLIVFGNEAWGVCDQLKQLADVKVLIRRYGAADSLNVSVACGVILSALHKIYDE